MPMQDYQGYKKKLYNIKEDLHERMVKRAKKEGKDLSDAVNDAMELYLSSGTVARAKKG